MLGIARATRRFGLVAGDAVSFRAEAGDVLGGIGPSRAGGPLRGRFERAGDA